MLVSIGQYSVKRHPNYCFYFLCFRTKIDSYKLYLTSKTLPLLYLSLIGLHTSKYEHILLPFKGKKTLSAHLVKKRLIFAYGSNMWHIPTKDLKNLIELLESQLPVKAVLNEKVAIKFTDKEAFTQQTLQSILCNPKIAFPTIYKATFNLIPNPSPPIKHKAVRI